ncbi:hypothetical protein HHL19_20940 [Streptomyces sp. R302]|uniref:hypothetical protein n=1 Tax=unclassified Streptomyces TaxID=2593676 RepID=UPI00145CAA5E|nr:MULTISPECIES: hypothetical protein [unclassified Streptomyces]NML50974.1 hypothetical protein [Streptomyces sp. R301]NML81068.1 hypothetical protein [Streptomyces sp. R302]
MAILVHAVLDGITTDQYDTLNARLQSTPEIFEGCISHACVPTGSGLEIFDLWESEAQMEAFADKMMPIAVGLGWPEGARPRVAEVHRYWVPGAAG